MMVIIIFFGYLFCHGVRKKNASFEDLRRELNRKH